MVITLTGENSFALQAELIKLTRAFTAKHGDLGLERLDGQEASLPDINEALNATTLLADNKLVILRQPGSNKQFAEQVEQIIDDLPETTDVIIIEPKLDKRLSYYKFLKSKTDFRTFPEIDSNGLARWLVTAAKQQGGLLNPGDARYLVERVGVNQQLLANELDKLILYNPKISRQSIDALTDPAPQSTIFQLLEAAFAGRAKTVLKLYGEQRSLKVEPSQIIAMLTWQLHVLAIIKTAGDRSIDVIASEAKINPFVVRKSQAIARNLSLARLKKLLNDLLVIDVKTKRTGIDPDEALQHYLLAVTE
jgi:DNA polymerase III subunit delta